eukprot:TRINITY_DN2361_c0_g1_i3.p1 TRINITY_DN2361_c0_g1~~TRINITY_DN2361_c0_g1_i3.p1  ORF type:complete len:101 (+),score=8.80 TRINITY_DN2361_c0_g1_i3:93-395(+)
MMHTYDSLSSLPLSHWIMYHRKRHKQSVNVWAEEFNKVTPKRKLIFLYLANDIVQNSRKKGIEFIHEFGKVLPQAITSSYSYHYLASDFFLHDATINPYK